MALEWMAVTVVVGVQSLLLLVATFPGSHRLGKGIASLLRSLLRPLLSVVPFALFCLLDLYWKFERQPHCEAAAACTAMDREHYAKAVVKNQRNALLVLFALLEYWLLCRVTAMLTRIDHLQRKVMKNRKDGDEDEDSE